MPGGSSKLAPRLHRHGFLKSSTHVSSVISCPSFACRSAQKPHCNGLLDPFREDPGGQGGTTYFSIANSTLVFPRPPLRFPVLTLVLPILLLVALTFW